MEQKCRESFVFFAFCFQLQISQAFLKKGVKDKHEQTHFSPFALRFLQKPKTHNDHSIMFNQSSVPQRFALVKWSFQNCARFFFSSFLATNIFASNFSFFITMIGLVQLNLEKHGASFEHSNLRHSSDDDSAMLFCLCFKIAPDTCSLIFSKPSTKGKNAVH